MPSILRLCRPMPSIPPRQPSAVRPSLAFAVPSPHSFASVLAESHLTACSSPGAHPCVGQRSRPISV
jgi:hypothetical protein